MSYEMNAKVKERINAMLCVCNDKHRQGIMNACNIEDVLPVLLDLLSEWYKRDVVDEMLLLGYFICRHFGMSDDEFLSAIDLERARQDVLFPDVSKLTDRQWWLIATEEYGEIVQAYNDLLHGRFESMESIIIMETIQFVSVIVRYIESRA